MLSRKLFALLSKKSFEPTVRSIHLTAPALKDKFSQDQSSGPRKSRFAKDDDEPTEKVIRSDSDKAKLEQARKEREQKKKETRAKQLEIQKKRDAEKKEKSDKTAAKMAARKVSSDE